MCNNNRTISEHPFAGSYTIRAVWFRSHLCSCMLGVLQAHAVLLKHYDFKHVSINSRARLSRELLIGLSVLNHTAKLHVFGKH